MSSIKFYNLILLLLVYQITFSQEPAKPSQSSQNKIMVGVNLFYYHPNIDNLNSGFTKMESKLMLPSWKNISIDYLVAPTIIYNLDRNNQIALQVGGSYASRVREDNKSYYYIWLVGGEYRYRFLARTLPTSEAFVTLGTGMLSAKFHRTYGNDVGINAFARKPYINAGIAFSLEVTKQVDVGIDARYMFVPIMKFDNLKSEVSLKSFMAGISINYSL